MNIINKTTKDILLKCNNGNNILLPTVHPIPKIKREIKPFETCEIKNGLTFQKFCIAFNGCENIPKKENDTLYIVSLLICQMYPERDDFYISNDITSFGKTIESNGLSKNPFCIQNYEEEIIDDSI